MNLYRIDRSIINLDNVCAISWIADKDVVRVSFKDNEEILELLPGEDVTAEKIYERICQNLKLDGSQFQEEA